MYMYECCRGTREGGGCPSMTDYLVVNRGGGEDRLFKYTLNAWAPSAASGVEPHEHRQMALLRRRPRSQSEHSSGGVGQRRRRPRLKQLGGTNEEQHQSNCALLGASSVHHSDWSTTGFTLRPLSRRPLPTTHIGGGLAVSTAPTLVEQLAWRRHQMLRTSAHCGGGGGLRETHIAAVAHNNSISSLAPPFGGATAMNAGAPTSTAPILGSVTVPIASSAGNNSKQWTFKCAPRIRSNFSTVTVGGSSEGCCTGGGAKRKRNTSHGSDGDRSVTGRTAHGDCNGSNETETEVINIVSDDDDDDENDDIIDEDDDDDESDDCSTDESPSSLCLTEEKQAAAQKSNENTTQSAGVPLIGCDKNSKNKGVSVGWPLRPSLFPNIPPYIRFSAYDAETAVCLPAGGQKFFKWKLSNITPVIVRKTLMNSGFALVRKSNQWLGTWGKHMKSPQFRTLKTTQKINHFPGTFQLGRKDRLWRNLQRLIARYGYEEFGLMPQTYLLPLELKQLKQNWEYNKHGQSMWIVKPPASARGAGIKVINKWSQLPKKTALVVQRYITSPYLINGSKFDLRLYVLVTSFHPLRMYLYPDGLVRFASAKYTDSVRDLKDRYVHLTNYSINKLSSQYTTNEDAAACHGHKWTLSALFEYMRRGGDGTGAIDTAQLWRRLCDLVVRTVLAGEPPIVQLCTENAPTRYNCYELFGIDVLLDQQLRPWLLEVNISPSLHSASPLDAHVKGPLVQQLFNLAQFHLPPRLQQFYNNNCGGAGDAPSADVNSGNCGVVSPPVLPSAGVPPPCLDSKLYTGRLLKYERDKHAQFESGEFSGKRSAYLERILEHLTGDDVRHLVLAEDEYCAKGQFQRIFPTGDTHHYLEFMDARYYNRLFDAWETKYEHQRESGRNVLRDLCAQRIHLKVAPSTKLQSNGSENIMRTNPTLSLEKKIVQEGAPSCTAATKNDHSRRLTEILQEVSISLNQTT